MPRQAPARSVTAERNLAARVSYERRQRGLSHDAFAKLVTDAGCPMRANAVLRIEEGDPPRRINVDELVAIAKALNVKNPMDLTMPLEAALTEGAHEAWIAYAEAVREREVASARELAALETLEAKLGEPRVAALLANSENASPALRSQAFAQVWKWLGADMSVDLSLAWQQRDFEALWRALPTELQRKLGEIYGEHPEAP